MNNRLFVKNNSSKMLIIVSVCQFLSACSSQPALEAMSSSEEKNRAQWQEQLKWPVSCDEGVSHITQYNENFVGVEVRDWVAGQKLISVICEASAYQQGVIFYLQKDTSINRYELVSFPQFRLQKDVPATEPLKEAYNGNYYQYTDAMVSGKLIFDNVNGRIRVDHFYRSGGGCGMSTIYSVMEKEASVVSLSVKDKCDEFNTDISHWQKII